jgi:hypothetical protein
MMQCPVRDGDRVWSATFQLWRRFSICRIAELNSAMRKRPPLASFERLADCKSAIRQIENLRYLLARLSQNLP